MKKYTVGIDIGGTNIKFGIVNDSGRIIKRSHLITERFIRDKKSLIEAVVREIFRLIQSVGLSPKDILGIGVGLPGLVNPVKGMVDFLPNIPGWKNVPLTKIIHRETGLRVIIENDVNLITLGEWKFGAGRGCRNLVCITLGTGVGGGLIFNNALYRGEGYAAGEIGHVPLNEKGPACNCGGYGCFECYVGNRQLLSAAAGVFKKTGIRLQDIYPLARRGEKRALQFWKNAATHIADGLVGVVNLLNPRLIIIGGGVANNYRFMEKTIYAVIQRRAMRVQAGMVRIARAQLGDDAGIIGAKVLLSRVSPRAEHSSNVTRCEAKDLQHDISEKRGTSLP